jgi:hypothetical protein
MSEGGDRGPAAPRTDAALPSDLGPDDPALQPVGASEVPPVDADPPRVAPARTDDPDERSADLRLARIHLRMGSLELARAELESFAGAGRLDPDALLDLAEIRWRTGDLPGAGVAAQAHLGTGEEALMALVIAAEAAAAAGHPGEAHRLASQAVEQLEAPGPVLDRLFAGMPRSGIWPLVPEEAPQPDGLLFAIPPAAPVDATHPAAGAVAGTAWAAGQAAAGSAPAPRTAPAQASAAGLWDDTGPDDERAFEPFAPVGGQVGAAGIPGDEPLELHPEVLDARAALDADDHEAAVAHLTALLQRRPDLARSVVAALEPDSGPDAGAAGPKPSSTGSDDPPTEAEDGGAAKVPVG